MIALKRILVPHDFSEASAAAVAYAVALARRFRSDLEFLYVGDHARAAANSEFQMDDDGAVPDAIRERLLAELTPANRVGLNAEFYVRTGTPAAEIVRLAGEHAIDLIVMGTHGRGFVRHMVMGSVAETVVRTAPCPVLTVRNTSEATQRVAVADLSAEALRAAV